MSGLVTLCCILLVTTGSRAGVWSGEALELGGVTTLEGKAEILKLDDHLRKEALNPGTTADLVGACLMVALLCGWVF